MGPSTKSDFEANVRAALEYVRLNIREFASAKFDIVRPHSELHPANTLVNLFGAWQLTDIYAVCLKSLLCYQPKNVLTKCVCLQLTMGQDYW
jgi:hypothetical protein